MQHFKLIIILFFYLIDLPHALGQTFTDFNEFKSYIQQYVERQVPHRQDEDVKINIIQLDSNTKIPSCNQLIETKLSQQELSSTSNVVQVTCNGNQTWSLYVPLQIQVFTKVLAAARMIKPGEVIEKQDITTSKKDKYQLFDGYYTHIDQVTGKVAARVIPNGGVFARKNLKKLPLVKKKQSVKLIIKHGSIEVTMQGVALTNGFLHDQIKILNPSSKRIVMAEVVGNGKAQIKY